MFSSILFQALISVMAEKASLELPPMMLPGTSIKYTDMILIQGGTMKKICIACFILDFYWV